jgi:hypothetical protein
MSKAHLEGDVIISLNNLAKRISSHGGKVNESMAERYKYFVEHSERGKDCSYAKKCQDLFLRYDYEDVKAEFLETLKYFRIIEGENFGKE